MLGHPCITIPIACEYLPLRAPGSKCPHLGVKDDTILFLSVIASPQPLLLPHAFPIVSLSPQTSACLPVMVILADHLEVPSRTLCFTVFICCTWATLLTVKTSRITSKISGLFRSRIFIRSFMAMIMFCVLSSAPCLELFSAAPEGWPRKQN